MIRVIDQLPTLRLLLMRWANTLVWSSVAMRYVLIVLGVIGFLVGWGMTGSGHAIYYPLGLMMGIVGGVSCVIGFATCDIVTAIKRSRG